MAFWKFFKSFEVGPKSRTSFEKSLIILSSWHFLPFHCFLSYWNFGPYDHCRKKGRSYDYRLLEWAEVIACSAVGTHFGPFNMAETTHLLNHNLLMKILTFTCIFEGFL